PTLILILSLIQWTLDKRKDRRMAAAKARAQRSDARGGWELPDVSVAPVARKLTCEVELGRAREHVDEAVLLPRADHAVRG
ncbi:hypothetical protein, partial [Escherichia coli]|uniref:hypothetical protein n=1 Tax=Escherichia coli TaxID=562 RepID=UPI00215B4EF1